MNIEYEIVFKNIGNAMDCNDHNGLKTWKEIQQIVEPFEIHKKSSGFEYNYLITLKCDEIIEYFEESINGNFLEKCSLYLDIEYDSTHGLNHVPTIPISLFLQDLFLACSVTRPGAFNLVPEKVISNNSQDLRLKPLYSDIIEVACDSCCNWGWPNYQDISFSETWQWLNKIGFLNSLVSMSPPTKACSAIIELAGVGWLGPSEILSTSIALESLLVNHKNGVAKQIRDRLNLIFGNPSKNKNWVTKFYDERSKIAHGSASLPRPFAETDFDEDGKQLNSECCDYAYRAIGITIALLQILIKNQSSGFNFTETYNLEKLQ